MKTMKQTYLRVLYRPIMGFTSVKTNLLIKLINFRSKTLIFNKIYDPWYYVLQYKLFHQVPFYKHVYFVSQNNSVIKR